MDLCALTGRACRRPLVTMVVPFSLLLRYLFVHLPLLLFSKHDFFLGGFLFHGIALRFTLILALEEMSSYCLCNSGCGFAYVLRILRPFVYVFCALCATFAYIYGFAFVRVLWFFRTYMAFVYIERILRTYTAYLHDFQCGQS